MSLSLTRKTLARVAMGMIAPLLAVLVIASPAMGQSSAQKDQYGDGGQSCIKGLFVHASGTLKKPESTSYQYGTHAITDAQSGCTYALQSQQVDLDRYVSQEVKISGTTAKGYPLEGGPPLINVKEVKPRGGESPSGEKVTLTFKVKTLGEAPENITFRGLYGPPNSDLSSVGVHDRGKM